VLPRFRRNSSVPFSPLAKILLTLCLLCGPAVLRAQTALVTGTVTDETGIPLEGVTVGLPGTTFFTETIGAGRYELAVPEGTVTVVFQTGGYTDVRKTLILAAGDTAFVDVALKSGYKSIGLVEKRIERGRLEAGTIYLDPARAQDLPSTIGGIEGILKTFVGTNNELTSQYSVRGGNYDENLVYVNDFEIYRPYLTRSGQQEGLSFVNADLAAGVQFSLGGFAARYGDKMSSVLDVTYRRPRQFGGSVSASLLGVSAHLEGTGRNGRITYLLGARNKTNQYLLQAQPTKGVYNPVFTDIQGLVNWRVGPRWEVEAIGNYARNRFGFIPEQSREVFGLVNQALAFTAFYQGQEESRFDSRFAGISTTFQANDNLRLKLLASGFQTDEREFYDLSAEYFLSEVETDLGKENFGQDKVALGTGVIQNYARNTLAVNVRTLAHRGSYAADRHFVQWGADAAFTRIQDRLHEWERRDSAGFTQPYNPDVLEMARLYRSEATFDYARLSAFVQDNWRPLDSLDLTVTAGVRVTHQTLAGETNISPRAAIAYKPEWKRDVVFKLAGGLYVQPPFYREMRALDGTVNKDLRSQKSAHFSAGTDYNFRLGLRPFKFTTEVYYKRLWDLVPYEYDNVRIRYFGENSARGYAYGGEVRLYGDLVPDAPSWVSFGLLKTSEDLSNDAVTLRDAEGRDSATFFPGFIPRPSDQRAMLGLYLQDYLRKFPQFRVHLNLLYATGLPFGPPDRVRYSDTLRLPAYRRVDIGFSARLLDGAKENRPSHSFFRNLGSVWASLEVFNLLGIQNTLSYSWIQDQTTARTYAVPNRLTARLVNVKLVVRF